MSKKKSKEKIRNYTFSNHAFGQPGTMICECCNEKITSGDFLYAVKDIPHNDWGYVSWHRNCSSFADWDSVDKIRMNKINTLESERNDLNKYKNKMKKYDSIVSEIEEQIESLEEEISKLKQLYFPEPIAETDEEIIEEFIYV